MRFEKEAELVADNIACANQVDWMSSNHRETAVENIRQGFDRQFNHLVSDTAWESGFAAGVAWSEERDRLVSNMQEWSCHQPVNADYAGKIERAHASIAEHMEQFKKKLKEGYAEPVLRDLLD